jgi:predicted outer membrane lipoprotein
MPKKRNVLGKLFQFIAWLTGVLVSLAVAFGMINKVLLLPRWLGGAPVTIVAGWVVVVVTLLGVLIAIARLFE